MWYLWGFSYYNHEQEVGELAKEIGFTQVSLSSEVMPMIKMVPRGYTGKGLGISVCIHLPRSFVISQRVPFASVVTLREVQTSNIQDEFHRQISRVSEMQEKIRRTIVVHDQAKEMLVSTITPTLIFL